MPNLHDVMVWLHVGGATILLGTGIGIAYFMLMAYRTLDPILIAHVGRSVVIADIIFTASAVVMQPITGATLAILKGWPFTEGWLLVSIILYVLVGLCWLPVLWIQVEVKRLAEAAVEEQAPLPERVHKLMRIWIALGIPAFIGVAVILVLMLTRPFLKIF